MTEVSQIIIATIIFKQIHKIKRGRWIMTLKPKRGCKMVELLYAFKINLSA